VDERLAVGFLIFPTITQLDMTGPYEVFRSLPGAIISLVGKSLDPVTAEGGMRLTPDVTIADCGQLDVICVPGGAGINALLEDDPVLTFLRRQAAGARYVTSVCTGALVLGAAGLLRGRRATTHWASHDLLAAFGAIPTDARVVRDGNVFTGGGVTAGIDFALTLVAEIAGDDVARRIQLMIEYAPSPPFDSGTITAAPAAVLQAAKERGADMRRRREEIVARVTGQMAAIPRP
jgi:cyclohexyl-isocyanide hydratase